MSISLHLILGGSGSGKSRYAEEIVKASARQLPVTYVATYAAIATASDVEMEARLLRHRERRPTNWTVIENRFDLEALFQKERRSVILLDSLTLWLSYRQASGLTKGAILAELEQALGSIAAESPGVIVVSDEVGMGLVPSTPEGRDFRDLVGEANQLVARLASRVELIVAGLPLSLKKGGRL